MRRSAFASSVRLGHKTGRDLLVREVGLDLGTEGVVVDEEVSVVVDRKLGYLDAWVADRAYLVPVILQRTVSLKSLPTASWVHSRRARQNEPTVRCYGRERLPWAS